MPLHKETAGQRRHRSRGDAVVGDARAQAAARPGEAHVADYRRDLVQRFFEQMLNERFDELTRRPDAKFLGAGIYGGNAEPGRRDGVARRERAGRQDRRRARGRRDRSQARARVRLRRRRAGSRASKWMAAFYERAYTERDKTESGSFAQEYLNHFLEGEPSPGIEYEYTLVQQLLPGITAAEVSAAAQDAAGGRQPRGARRRRRRRPASRCRPRTSCARRWRSAESAAVTPWNDTTSTRELIENKPEPAAVTSTRTVRRSRRDHRQVRQRRRGVAEADRLQERPGRLHAAGEGGHVAGAAGRLPRSVAGDRLRRASRARPG